MQDLAAATGVVKGFVPTQYVTGAPQDQPAAGLGAHGEDTPSSVAEASAVPSPALPGDTSAVHTPQTAFTAAATQLVEQFDAAVNWTVSTPVASPARSFVSHTPTHSWNPGPSSRHFFPPSAAPAGAPVAAAGAPPQSFVSGSQTEPTSTPPVTLGLSQLSAQRLSTPVATQPSSFLAASTRAVQGGWASPAHAPHMSGAHQPTPLRPFTVGVTAEDVAHADSMDVFAPAPPALGFDAVPDVPVPPPRSTLARLYAAKFGQSSGETQAGGGAPEDAWREQVRKVLDTPSQAAAIPSTAPAAMPATNLPLGRVPTLEEFKLLRKMKHASVSQVPVGDVSKYVPPAVANVLKQKNSAYRRPSLAKWAKDGTSMASRFAAVASKRQVEQARRRAAEEEAKRSSELANQRKLQAIASGVLLPKGSTAEDSEEDLETRMQRIRRRAVARSGSKITTAATKVASAKPQAHLQPSVVKQLASLNSDEVGAVTTVTAPHGSGWCGVSSWVYIHVLCAPQIQTLVERIRSRPRQLQANPGQITAWKGVLA
mgnify:CR=1 FL=1